ncbi:MAG: AAA family ATPase [Deltaproteobacteria bacterium]|nr:AAA family ATPase [Deltaproteobacteria bacterium]
MTDTATGGVDLLLSRLRRVRSVGDGRWIASCSAPGHGKGHGDVNPSLSISCGNGSGPLIKCFAGCETEAILKAIGLDWQDILPLRETPVHKSKPMKGTGATAKPSKITRYEIRDAGGNLIAIHIREDLAKGKRMRWELPNGTPNLGGIKTADLPLYGVDSLAAAAPNFPVVIAEGEKAAEALCTNEVLAVGTVTGASGTPGDGALRQLLGRPVFLWPDNDGPGQEHMARIGAALHRLGHRDIHEIYWKGAPDKGDAADLFQLEGAMDEYEVLVSEARKVEGPAAAEEKKTSRPLFESLATLLANPIRPRWLIKGLIETPATGVIFGASGAGKSFVAVDLAGSCAAGEDWAGREVASPGPVYYIAGEGRGPLIRRFQAWQFNRKVTIPADRLFISSSRIELDDRGAAGVKGEIEQRAKETGASPSLIIIDTMARALPSGSDENSAKDVGDFINTVDLIRDLFNCVVLIIHHSGHMEEKRARGSSALRAALDVELCITNREGARIAEWTKLKDLPEEPCPQEFVLERVLVSAEEDGDLISSAVVSWQGQAARRPTITQTRTEKLGLKTLTITILEEESSSTSLDAWREEFYSQHWGDNDAAKQKAFRRVRESLVGKDLIVVRDGLYSLPDKRTDTDISGLCPGASPDRHGHTPIGVSVCPALSGEEGDVQYNLPKETT